MKETRASASLSTQYSAVFRSLNEGD